MKSKRVEVSKRALIQRINRVLGKQDEVLRVTRTARSKQEYGDYMIIDTRLNAFVSATDDIEALGRELEVLAEWEKLLED
jgi:hypothetical protein